MCLIGKVGSPEQKLRFLAPLVAGHALSAFFMTEPAREGGAGSDPSMMQTTALLRDIYWVINGRKALITGAQGASVGIVMAKADDGACLLLFDLPDPAMRIERILDTIDSSMPAAMLSSRSTVCAIPPITCSGCGGEGFKYAQIGLSPARLSHCIRRLGACVLAHEIASDYACTRYASVSRSSTPKASASCLPKTGWT